MVAQEAVNQKKNDARRKIKNKDVLIVKLPNNNNKNIFSIFLKLFNTLPSNIIILCNNIMLKISYMFRHKRTIIRPYIKI
jgi:hypothetical protein